MTGLLPSRDAFAFGNSWPPGPALTVRTPLGTLPIGNVAGGLCGGMVYAVLDHWHVGRRPPLERPGPGDPLFRFIVRRLLDSWDLPVGVLRYYRWMLAPDGDRMLGLLGRRMRAERGLARRTLAQQWPLIRAELDAGIPVGLGLVTVNGPDPRALPLNHQVLAYGYRADGPAVTVRVYDPNSGPRDDVAIRFHQADPGRTTTFTHDIGIAGPVRGFFRTAYRPVIPPP
jgi:hypothetical protein